MAHRIYRLAISPEQAPEVRRVVDFDGRHTLADVHLWLGGAFGLRDHDHLYSFYLSGRFGDAESEYVDPRTDGRRADKAMLFRLGLRIEMSFAYTYDFGSERRFSLIVLGIADSSQPLGKPVLVESVGEPPVHEDPFAEDFSESDEDWTDDPHPIDSTLSALAEAVLDLQDLTHDPEGSPPGTDIPQPVKVFLCQMADAALALAEALGGELKPLVRLDYYFADRELMLCLLSLPLDLFDAGEVERSIKAAQALAFVSPDEVNGDLAAIYARAGQREAALQQVAINLERAEDRYTAEAKAGDVYRALGEDDAAEAYYRRSLAEATTTTEIAEARLNVTTLLLDTDRQVEAAAFVAEQGQRSQAGLAEDSEPFEPAASEPELPRVGRNDPCPCGSTKKYKKCHGA